MTEQRQRDTVPEGGSPQPDELPREVRPGKGPASAEPEGGGPLPDTPMNRDPLLNPGPLPADRPKDRD